MSEVVNVTKDLYDAIALLRRLERAYDRGNPIIELMVDVKTFLQTVDGDAPTKKRYRCGACRDTGRWENGIECPTCFGYSKEAPPVEPGLLEPGLLQTLAELQPIAEELPEAEDGAPCKP